MCERCHEHTGRIVHHIIHLSPELMSDPDICYSFTNLELVCLDCHNVEHGFRKPDPDRQVKYFFDADGNPVPAAGGDSPR